VRPEARVSAPVVPYAAAYDRLGRLADEYRGSLGDDLSTYERKLFSQNGEDGVTAEILRRIEPASRWFVEFGAGTGGEGCCVFLADVFGWSGLFIEADGPMHRDLAAKYAANPRVKTVHAAVKVATVEDLFRTSGVPTEPDVLTIDIDGNDYWVWRAIRGYRPRLVIIEYNANLPPDSRLVRALDEEQGWDRTGWFSASILALEELAGRKGYALVYTDLSGCNAFFVRDDLVEKVGVSDPPRRGANYGLVGGRFEISLDDHSWVEAPTD
jgi:hypothetical protein